VTRQTTIIGTLLTLTLAPAAFAQEPAAPSTPVTSVAPVTNDAQRAAAAADALQRRQMRMFEGALQTSVRQGGEALVRQQAPELPHSLQLTANDPQVRGFAPPLGGGLYFYVAIPEIRVLITELFMDQLRPPTEQPLRQAGRTRQGPPVNAASGLAGAQVAQPDPMTTSPEGANAPVPDDGRCSLRTTRSPSVPMLDYLYAVSVCDALMDAMLDNSGALSVKEGEWLTIMLAPEAVGPGVINPTSSHTTYLQIQGSDLLAYRQGKLTRDEARKRIEMKR
jgi:hypothetical protein